MFSLSPAVFLLVLKKLVMFVLLLHCSCAVRFKRRCKSVLLTPKGQKRSRMVTMLACRQEAVLM